MKKTYLILFVFAAIALFACNSPRQELSVDPETKPVVEKPGSQFEPARVIKDTVYTMTIASKQVKGVHFSCGNQSVAMVYAVKTDSSPKWFNFWPSIDGLDYKPGFEYQIEVREKVILDHSVSEPSWSEYSLVRLISKTEKESSDLPDSFLPEKYKDLDLFEVF